MRGSWLHVVGLAVLALLGVACDKGAPAAQGGPPVDPPPSGAAEPEAAGGERHFGQPLRQKGAAVPVEALLASPEPHLGTVVQSTGVVARVCQAAGCWLELQPAEGGEGLRVPMANHAFFIPQDAVGQRATVEGELKRQALPTAQRDHYASEGMQAMGPLSLDATSVVLH